METVFRRAVQADLACIMEIITAAQEFLKQQGLDQWQDGYPSPVVIQRDIEEGTGYVLLQADKIVGTIAVCPGREPAYAKIYEGAWLGQEENYMAVHRVAVRAALRGSGIADQLLKSAQAICENAGAGSIRIDTHPDNMPMRKFLQKQGYTYSGVIYLECGAARIAYEKSLL